MKPKKYFTITERTLFKFCGGVYILLNKGVIVYIGKTQSIFERMLAHKKDKEFDCFRIFFCDDRMMQHYEQRLIKIFRPRYNKTGFKGNTLFKDVSLFL